MYYNLKTKEIIEEKPNKGLNFLYNSTLGRIILKIATKKWITSMSAWYMNSRLSKHRIKKFIKTNNIDMSEYEDTTYKSFNEFFMRNIKSDKRPIDEGLYAISDSKLSVYEINKDLTLNIKDSMYTIDELIQEDSSKHNYKYALIFRLCVDDYHHYVFPDDGKIISNKYIKGVFHTVQPIALKKFKVFKENSREVTFLECKNLGDVCMIEVGALCVGKIVNEKVSKFKRGQEKGHFEFGGSTVVMLLEDKVKIDRILLKNTSKEIETIVKLGNKIGKIK